MGDALDARTLRDAMSRFLEALRAHRQEIDSLNVFPVPDGDTGTNMLLTQQAVDDSLRAMEGTALAEMGQAISRPALMGARGNSGVILSQVLRGFCDRLCRVESPGAGDLAAALELGSAEAGRAVADPVEGTMLTVLADAAAAAREAAGDGAPPGLVADAALKAAEGSLARTPELLPALGEAGVVDAGGKGIVLLLDALRSAVEGIPLSVEVGPLGPAGEPRREAPSATDYGYEVMYLVECQDRAIPGLRVRLGGLGDSVVVVGGGGLYNVHVHTDDPGRAIDEGLGAGRPRGIRVVSLDEQVAGTCVGGEARAVRVGEEAVGEEAVPVQTSVSALVAVVPGEGTAELFRSLGAAVVKGGPGSNPSVGELVEAIAAAPSRAVVLLPNHGNLVPAAERAAAESEKDVAVIPTGSVPEGLGAATAFNPDVGLEDNVGRGREAAGRVISVEVAQASRDANTPAGPVAPGGFLGLAGGEVRAVGDDPVRVAVDLLRPLVEDEHEILTVLTGDGTGAQDADRAAEALAKAFPRLEVEVHAGGQPHYPLVIGLE